MVIEKWNNNEAFEKWNNNEAFEKWNNNNIFLEIVGIKSDFKWHHIEYWKNNWLIKKLKKEFFYIYKMV